MKTDVVREEFTVLVVDDEAAFRNSVRRILHKESLALLEAADGEEALSLLARARVHIALVDIHMPALGGLELLDRIRKEFPLVKVIMVTGLGDTASVVRAMKAGAVDFLEKESIAEAIGTRISQAHRIWELERDNLELRRKVASEFEFTRLVGESPPLARLKEIICQVGATDVSVIVEGETGTGKELVARAIHHQSERRGKPFVVVDCGAISETLIESELFGHVKGAYTGAHSSDEGLFMAAGGGTVFLDEIGEMPMSLQVKLLRVLQEREVRPVGSPRSLRIDIRVVAATNKRLEEQVRRGSFREDLFYRIAVVTLAVPPLRERVDDIPLLINHMLAKFGRETPRVSGIDPQTLNLLERHSWPGNVRELENVLRRALVLSRGPFLKPEDLPDDFGSEKGSATEASAPAPANDSLAAYEKTAIMSALERSGGSRRQAARLLGIAEATLYRKLKLYGIE
jgi:DNA-binding NtrC family response regulator